MSLQPYLKRIIEHRETLTRAEAAEVLHTILRAEATDLDIAALLTTLATRGETPEEIAGFVDAMRAAATPIPLTDAERLTLVDTCGTGADSSGTFNISTAAALVAAAAGATSTSEIRVAKHGNRAVTSQSGSADVLEALGIPISLSPDDGATALRTHRFAFFHAPALHPAMKAVMPVRRALGIRTIFHLVGPLSNPAGASAQVMGVYAPHLVSLAAQAMALLNTRHAFVVHGETGKENQSIAQGNTGSARDTSGIDEFSISGPSHYAEVHNGIVTQHTITPEELGLTRAPIEALHGGNAQTNAKILTAIFAGESGPRRNIVLLNAAAVLVTADLATNLPTGIALAVSTIDSGAVTKLVHQLKTQSLFPRR